MCGITGLLEAPDTRSAEGRRGIVAAMTTCIAHRGPDSDGLWFDQAAGLGFGHRRLAILDLSPEGYQPMHSADGRYTIVFNGEIYNFRDLRADLEAAGHTFRGHSDTEIMLAAFVEWGVEAALTRFNGMFAFGLWDQHERRLVLARDRAGEKPLYYGWLGDSFVFASELKALREHPHFTGEINREALALYLRYGYIPAPWSIYDGIHKLPPATLMILNADRQVVHEGVYWSAREVAERGARQPFTGTAEEAVARLDHLLREAIARQMIADVPLGAFLSGGIDSSTIVALMQAISTQPVKTFTIGFEGTEQDEAPHARAIAQHLGTDHTEMMVSAQKALDTVPLIPQVYDEPFGDTSQIPTYLIAQLTRHHVTVSLSGDAGDELFAGYERYKLYRERLGRIAAVPRPVRSMTANALDTLSTAAWDRLLKPVPRASGKRVGTLIDMLRTDEGHDMYMRAFLHWTEPERVVNGVSEPPSLYTDRSQWADLPDHLQQIFYLDMVGYLPDDILVKVDRAAMAVSLETRIPLLDQHVIEFAWSLPVDYKIRNEVYKWPLRQILYQHVPRELIDRPKSGFGIPVNEWLRGPLRDWAEDLLDAQRMREAGYLNPDAVHERWSEFISGQRNWGYTLWDVLMFQAWIAHYG